MRIGFKESAQIVHTDLGEHFLQSGKTAVNGVQAMQVSAEHEVSVFREVAVGELAGGFGGVVGEAVKIALEEYAEVLELGHEGGIGLEHPETLGVREDDGAAALLEVLDDGGKPAFPLPDPCIDEEVFAEVGVGREGVGIDGGEVGAEADFAAGV